MAQLWTGLFTFVRQLSFNESCLASVFVLAKLVLFSPNPHIGSHLQASAVILFAAAFGTPYAGAVISLARTPGSGFAGTLAAFAIVAFIPVAVLRASPPNPRPAIFFTLIFGVAVINSLTAWPAPLLWHQVVAYLIAALCLSSSGAILATLFILPTLAGDELRETLGGAIQGLGHQLSGYAGALLASRDDSAEGSQSSGSSGMREQMDKKQVAAANESPSARNLRKQMTLPEERESIERFLKSIRKNSDPDRVKSNPSGLHPHPTQKQLRSALKQAAALVAEAEFEPSFLQAGRQIADEWKKIISDTQKLATRIATLHLLIEGGQLLHSELLQEMCRFDPLPTFRLAYAQLGCACSALGQAVRAQGSQQVAELLMAVPWQKIRDELRDCVCEARAGYWARHVEEGSVESFKTPESLEVRVLLFLVTLTGGIMDALACLESSVPAALGCELTLGPPESPRQGDCKEVKLEVSEGSSKAGESRRLGFAKRSALNFAFVGKMLNIISGREAALQLKAVFWDEFRDAISSRTSLTTSLKNRKLQFGFKYWLACMAALVLAVAISHNFPHTRAWRLYYGYLTTAIVMIERVEAAAWKILQRVLGTLVGGTLGYLIMLREGVHSRGAAVLALVCTSSFVIAQGLHTKLRYTVFLTILTLTSLTICQHPQCCTPGSDYRLWAARVLNIVCGCVLAMSVSWLVFPWYASDEHLELLADAYDAAGILVGDFYDVFHEACRAAATEGGLLPKEKEAALDNRLEAEIVRKVEAVLLGLERDTVIWHRGLLATPPIVLRLTDSMTGLVHRTAALELAVLQSPEHFGAFSGSIYTDFIGPMHSSNSALMKSIAALSKAVRPILLEGWTPERAAAAQEALDRVESSRVAVVRCFQQLRTREHVAAFSADRGRKTSGDAVKLSSWMVAASKMFDQMMLVAKTAIAEGLEARETRLSSLITYPWGSGGS